MKSKNTLQYCDNGCLTLIIIYMTLRRVMSSDNQNNEPKRHNFVIYDKFNQ